MTNRKESIDFYLSLIAMAFYVLCAVTFYSIGVKLTEQSIHKKCMNMHGSMTHTEAKSKCDELIGSNRKG